MQSCIQMVQANLKDQAVGYLLGEHTYPHITVCQFAAEHSQLDKIWSSIEAVQPKPLKISFGHIYILPGRGAHIGKTWIGLTVIKSTQLLELQKAVYEILAELGIQGSTKVNNYTPHLTWARCDGDKPVTIPKMPPPELWQNQHSFNLTIGLSDASGVYQECLFSTHQPDLAKRSVT